MPCFELPPAVLTQALAGTALTAVLGLMGYAVRPDAAGWRYIKVSPTHWGGVVLGAGLTCLLTYIYVFVGSARADAVHQMTLMFWLTLLFGVATLYIALSMAVTIRQRLHWRDEVLVFSHKGRLRRYGFADVIALKSTMSGDFALDFVDGCQLVVDADASGAMELIDELEIYFLDPTNT